ncbi:MAG: SufS family cysteine desulfurase [Bdellovibrionales bacterium]
MIELDVRKDFPTFEDSVRGNPIIYLDSGASTLKPKPVIDALADFYLHCSSNVHRGAHYLSDAATIAYEGARQTVKSFIGAPSVEDIIFTSGTTDSINMLANILGRSILEKGDEVILSEMEHHSNIVPWYILSQEKGIEIKVVPVLDNGELDMKVYEEFLNKKTKLVSLVYVSNAIGTLNPVKQIIDKAHSVGALVHLDAAQAVSAMPVNVSELDVDFISFSSHKLFGPTGIGVLYGKADLLNSLPPYRGGGSMIDQVTFGEITYLKSPQRFEAGTPHIAGAFGLGESLRYLQSIGMDKIHNYENELSQKGIEMLSEIEGLTFLGGQSDNRMNVLSFNLEGVHPSDVGAILDQQGIAVRCGHHCCMPLMKRFAVPGTIRASVSIYNNIDDLQALRTGLLKAKELLQ